MMSKFQSTQKWLSQFLLSHRKIAEQLLDNLIFINTTDMMEDLKFLIKGIISEKDKVAILPIRELRDDEYVYSLDDKDKNPVLQTSNEALGSEAFISNLYTQLNRENNVIFHMQKKEVESEWYDVSPSLNYLSEKKYTKLLLIDDLIGSGDRVQKYLENIFNHKTIKSWVSGGFLEIYIVAYMASDIGIEKINKRIKNLKGIHLNYLHKAPTFHDVVGCDDILELCKSYASKNNKYPLGYKDCAVRVIFGHSAPNNIPAILHSSTLKKFKASDRSVSNSSAWHALFHKRVIPSDFLVDCKNKPHLNPRKIIVNLLTLLSEGEYKEQELCHIFNLPAYEVDRILNHLESFGWVNYDAGRYNLTLTGRSEVIPKNKSLKQIESAVVFYYPWR
ncbi:hypothetical protein LZV53_16055 [Klebsiella michiganensis]|uniref:phosphoribosyltransferase-like protein n=1 Tax=Klebsiella michiganensis TaxID=1134687 RepID=UPI001F164717|nr:hypothetical protein [Klebsiella michiganensis]MCE7546069.1 hypothetical protein [Klebsiella michiganensis]